MPKSGVIRDPCTISYPIRVRKKKKIEKHKNSEKNTKKNSKIEGETT